MKEKINIANAVTLSRIVFAVLVHRLLSMHTWMNKITGILLFLLPLIICKVSWQATEMIIIVTGLIATFAAIQEGHYIRTGREIE